jgi:hypothetical protein
LPALGVPDHSGYFAAAGGPNATIEPICTPPAQRKRHPVTMLSGFTRLDFEGDDVVYAAVFQPHRKTAA